MGEYRVALVPGDGIGPEVIAPAVDVLEAAGKRFGHSFVFTALEAGGCAIDKYGVPLPEGTVEAAAQCGALLLGAVGGPAGTAFPAASGPSRPFFIYGRAWESLPTSGPPSSSPSCGTPLPLNTVCWRGDLISLS